MITRIPGELHTFTPNIWAGYSLDDIDAELNSKGAVLVCTDIELRFLYCNGKIYDPLETEDMKKAIDDMALCPFRWPVKKDLARALYQAIRRTATTLQQKKLAVPKAAKYNCGEDARRNTKGFALQQMLPKIP
ncbi:MAG TPA: hypothetical protein VGL38_01145 [bacterium]|jgi:hypothetical protein